MRASTNERNVLVMKTQNKLRPFGMRDKLAYAAGDLGCNMSFALKSTVQTFWLVYMMLETGLLSILLLLVQIWDAVNDPMIGSLIDNDKRSYKMGKFKTYILKKFTSSGRFRRQNYLFQKN